MIHYRLRCQTEHSFEGWFASAAAFDTQHKDGLVACPVCGSTSVVKALMAPALARPADKTIALSANHPEQAGMAAALRALREKVVNEAEYVGERFADEARRIHEGEAESRGIYGEATRDEVRGLIEDGIECLPLPSLPEEKN